MSNPCPPDLLFTLFVFTETFVLLSITWCSCIYFYRCLYLYECNCLKALKPVFILKLRVNSDGSALVFSFFCVDLTSLSCFAFSEFDVY